MERFSDASFFGKLLMLPANVRLDWKVIARYKDSSLFGLIISNEGKKVLCVKVAKTILFFVTDMVSNYALLFVSGKCFKT
jgi:hypothetical protein